MKCYVVVFVVGWNILLLLYVRSRSYLPSNGNGWIIVGRSCCTQCAFRAIHVFFSFLFFSYPKQAINENYIALGGLHIDHTRIIYFINLEAVSWFVRKFCCIDRTHSPSHCQVNNDRYITLLGTTVLLYRLVEKNSDRGLNTFSCLLPNQTIN